MAEDGDQKFEISISPDILEVAGEEFSIIDEVPTLDGSTSTEELIEQFTLPNERVRKFLKATRSQSKARKWGLFAIFGGYIIAIIVRASLDPIFGLPAEELNNISAGVFVTTFAVGVLLYLSSRIFENRAQSQNLTKREAVYHHLLSAIDSYRKGNLDDVENNLNTSRIVLESSNNDIFQTEFQDQLVDYIGRIENSDSQDKLQNTFPLIANGIMMNVSNTGIKDYDDIIRPYLEQDPSGEQYTVFQMIRSYFEDLFGNQIVRIIAPFIVSTPLILIIYLYVDRVVANIVFLAIIAILQIYYNMSD